MASCSPHPDLVERCAGGHPENQPDPATYYASGPIGYVDHATLTGSRN